LSDELTSKISDNQPTKFDCRELYYMPLLPLKNTLNINIKKYAIFYILFIALIQTPFVFAFEQNRIISLSELGDFDVTFSSIEKESFIVGQNLVGEVTYKSGENYSVVLPFDVQKVTYHIINGSYVNNGDTIATVEGFDVHHFIDEFTSAKQILKVSENHYKTNEVFFENKTIKSSQWIEITKNYFAAKLKVEHFQHQMSFLHIDKNETVTLISPKSGIVKTPNFNNVKLAGDLAFDVINKESIKVRVITPLFYNTRLSHFVVSSDCKLKINSVESIADKYHQILWASANSEQCQLTLGQSVKLTPILSFDGYKIPKSSLFEFNEKNVIAIKSANEVYLVPVVIVGANHDEYYVTSKEDISNQQALASSVSILQGKLLELGAE
jgi:hypothetical protein